jgi:hypothetical protein
MLVSVYQSTPLHITEDRNLNRLRMFEKRALRGVFGTREGMEKIA